MCAHLFYVSRPAGGVFSLSTLPRRVSSLRRSPVTCLVLLRIIFSSYFSLSFLRLVLPSLVQVSSLLAAWAVGLESLVLVQARHILCDIFLYFFNVATLGATFASVRPGLTVRQQVHI